jgi:hypothetical protein
MITREAAIAARCVRYQKEEFLHDIRYSTVGNDRSSDECFDAWEQCQNLLHRDLEQLGITLEEEWWVAWELGLQDWWGDSEEFWSVDPRVGTEFEAEIEPIKMDSWGGWI